MDVCITLMGWFKYAKVTGYSTASNYALGFSFCTSPYYVSQPIWYLMTDLEFSFEYKRSSCYYNYNSAFTYFPKQEV